MATTTNNAPSDGGAAADDSNTNCSACDSAAFRPHLTCFKCTEGVDVNGHVDSIQYCTARCRNLAAVEHNSECEKRNIRKQIYRAGELLQSSFYRFRELNYMEEFSRVYKSNGVLYFHRVPLQERASVFERSPYDVARDSTDAHAIMSAGASELSLAIQFELSKKLLGNIAKYIEEVYFDGVAVELKIREVFPNGRLLGVVGVHEALCVQTHADESYMIDLTGAKYGQPKAVLPLEKAVSFYGNRLAEVYPHGHVSSKQFGAVEKELAGTGDLGGNPRDRIIPMYMATLFNSLLASWEEARGVKVCDLLDSKQREYSLLEKAIDKFVLEASAQGRATLREAPPVRVLPLIQVAKNDDGRLSKPVIKTISKDYTGSVVGKKCRRFFLKSHQQNDPEKWQNVIQPFLAGGGEITFSMDAQVAKDKVVDGIKRQIGAQAMAAALAKMTEAANFWTCEALAN